METTFAKTGSCDAVMYETQGSIYIPLFYRADHLRIQRDGYPEDIIQCGEPSFGHQIREMHRCLRKGLTESPVMPLDESLENMETLDAIRVQ